MRSCSWASPSTGRRSAWSGWQSTFATRSGPDNAGYCPETPEIVAGGPDAYFSSLPLEQLKAALDDEQVPAAISLTAGPYLCNASMYIARHLLHERGTPCGFIHLPPTPDLACGAEPMPLDVQARGIRRVLDELA